MALSWSGRRQLLYTAVGVFVVCILLFVLWQTFFSQTPTCTDGVLNGDERGVDCGGACTLVCAADTASPAVLWKRAFPSTPPLYTAVAYVKNPNVGMGTKSVRYMFRLYDERHVLVAPPRSGVIDLPPVSLIPIVEVGINAGTQIAASAEFDFIGEEMRWERVIKELPAVRTTQQLLTSDATRLSATLVNDSLDDAHDLTVVAVLFDAQGVARAASKSSIADLPKRSSQDLVFTWSGGVPGIVRAEITILPSF